MAGKRKGCLCIIPPDFPLAPALLLGPPSHFQAAPFFVYPLCYEFTTDALHAPETVLPGHLLAQSDGFRCDPGAPTPVAGLEPPEQTETLAMPAQERIGLEDEDGFLPTLDPTGEEDEPEAIGWGEAWPLNLAMKDNELHAEESVLGNKLGVAASEIEGRAEKDSVPRWSGELEECPFQRHQCGAYGSDKPVD